MTIDATGLHFKTLNDRVRETVENKIVINNCIGQRYIASGMSDKEIIINGTPGNALGAYLNGVTLTVNGNAQDATGDTMNEGAIYIHGSSRLPCRHPHESVQGKIAGAHHRRRGWKLFGRIPGGRRDCGARSL